MIDEKKTKEAARGYCDAIYGTLKEEPFIAEGFRQGAQWAQQEFLKELWHDASERPRDSSVILVSKYPDTINLQGHTLNVLYYIPTNWDKYRIYHKIEKYLYVNDILPKEGGEE